MATLLDIVQTTCRKIGLPAPSAVVSSADDQIKTLLSLAKEAGDELSGDADWSFLTEEETLTAIAQAAQTNHPPSDFDRFTPGTDIWDNAIKRPLVGVVRKNEWMGLRVKGQTGPDKYWIVLNGVINIYPTPTASSTFTYMYQRKNWIRPTGATDSSGDKAEFTADTDEPLFDKILMVQSLTWRWKQAKQLDYAEDMETYERSKEIAIAADRGPQTIRTARVFRGDLPPTFWPGTITA